MALHSSLFNNNKTQQVLAPAIYNSDQLSAEIDMQDFSDLMLIADVGASGDTWSAGNRICFEVQESDTTGTGYAAAADSSVSNPISADATGTFAKLTANSQGSAAYVGAYRGSKRFVKVNVNFTGTHSTGSPIGVLAVLGMSRAQPQNNG